jgi:hypothetical protein
MSEDDEEVSERARGGEAGIELEGDKEDANCDCKSVKEMTREEDCEKEEEEEKGSKDEDDKDDKDKEDGDEEESKKE